MNLQTNFNTFKYIYDFTKNYYFFKGEVYENGRYKKKREECSDEEALLITELIYSSKVPCRTLHELYLAEQNVDNVLKAITNNFLEHKYEVANMISHPTSVSILSSKNKKILIKKNEENCPKISVKGLPKNIPLKILADVDEKKKSKKTPTTIEKK